MYVRKPKNKSLSLAIAASLCVHALFGVIVVYIIYSTPEIGVGGEGEAYVTTYIVSTGETVSFPRKRESRKFTTPQVTKQSPGSPMKKLGDDNQKQTASGTPGKGETGMPGDTVQTRRGKDDKLLRKIWSKINRSRYYPLAARRAGLEGVPRVRFAIAEDGTVTSATLASSCGIPELDEAAVQTVHRAAPLPHYPKPITLAIRYSLKK